ncbi:ankyrin repeat-containing domain protein [Tricladium varicosporioides]|nr:ankyrin repeat-containing domain protein [Hymenoscyphus varicosporioides]
MDAVSKPACANYVIEALLECGADPNYKSFASPLGWSTMATGCITYDEELGCQRARILLKGGAKIDGKSLYDNETALHAAAIWDLAKICSILINEGANLEVQAGYPAQQALYSSDITAFMSINVTPLHLAAQNNSPNAIKVLLDNGAHIDAETREGRTPLSIALRNHHREVAEILINRGAEIKNPHLLMNVMMAWGFDRDSFLRNTRSRIKLEEYKVVEMRSGHSQGSLLSAAVWRANPDSVKFVLNQGWDFDTQLYEVAEDEVLMANSPELGKALEARMNPENGGAGADAALEDFLEVLIPKGAYTPLQIAHILLDNPQDMTILRSQGEMRHYRVRMLEIISLLEKAGCPARVAG